MIRITELRLPLDHAADALRTAVAARLGVADTAIAAVEVFRRAADARRRGAIVLSYTVDAALVDAAAEAAVLARCASDGHVGPAPDMRYRFVGHAPADFAAGARPRPVVVGFGPCGLFAALILAQMGFAPIVVERGRAVRERTRDTWALWREGRLDPASNVQFGEGGAGTFSDGKLWSQIGDPRHLTRKVIAEFVAAGAPDEIAWVAKPHIGTFRLVSMIQKMRAQIVALGGDVRFGRRVVGLVLDANPDAVRRSADDADGRRTRRVAGIVLDDGSTLAAEHVVLAPGHSARDTFAMLRDAGVAIEPKPFAVGLRIEHPQGLIDRARWGAQAGHPRLGAADYKLVHHGAGGRAVYSFCMCPGGTVVAATSEEGRVVTNGMSQYSRNERNANAGLVVGVTPADWREHARGDDGEALAGVAFQRFWESRAFELGGGGYRAPAQRVGDFVARRPSTGAGEVLPSYTPGVTFGDLAAPDRPALPPFVLDAIRDAIPHFDRKLPGYALADAVLTGVETRTSSPLRIPRGRDRQSVNVAGLYPAGEGAGYAGGIMSAAVDGIETAEALASALLGLQPAACG